MTTSRVVFTALFGGYESLLEQPTGQDEGVDFICFTDDPDVRSETWRIVPYTPMFPTDLVRSQREIKIRGHEMLDAYAEWLYIDNSVELRVPAGRILDDWLTGTDYAVSAHSYRERVIDEFDEVIALNYDDAARVQEQLYHYAALYPDIIERRPYWNGMIARRPTPAVRAATARWFDHVLRYSRRDQLSANVALAVAGLDVRVMQNDNFESDIHLWPAAVDRKVHMGKTTRAKSGPLLAEIARLEREAIRVQGEHAEIERQSSAREAALADRIAHIELETARLQEVLDESSAHASRLEAAIEEFQGSRWWKATAPLRAATSPLHRQRKDHRS